MHLNFRFCLLFQAISSLKYSNEESVIILEQLYRNWSHVVSHLRLADRMKAFKYHMKKVFIIFVIIFASRVLFDFLDSVFFSQRV